MLKGQLMPELIDRILGADISRGIWAAFLQRHVVARMLYGHVYSNSVHWVVVSHEASGLRAVEGIFQTDANEDECGYDTLSPYNKSEMKSVHDKESDNA